MKVTVSELEKYPSPNSVEPANDTPVESYAIRRLIPNIGTSKFFIWRVNSPNDPMSMDMLSGLSERVGMSGAVSSSQLISKINDKKMYLPVFIALLDNEHFPNLIMPSCLKSIVVHTTT